MAQSGIPESFPSIKHTWLDKLQMSQAPRYTTYCNISLCHCWEVTALSPAPTSPNPTAHHGHQHDDQHSSALILNRIDLIG